MARTKERDFEDAIEHHLLTAGGWATGNPKDFDPTDRPRVTEALERLGDESSVARRNYDISGDAKVTAGDSSPGPFGRSGR